MKTFKGKNNEVLGTFLEDTDVIVNPTLTGNEPEMTGIQVGGQKYKAPQGGDGVNNLCDYYFNLASINAATMFNDARYYLYMDDIIQYVKDSGIGDIPFEPNLEGTESSGIELISSRDGTVSSLELNFYNQTTSSNSSLFIDMFEVNFAVDELINEEGDTFLEFLIRNRDAIQEVFRDYSFGGNNIHQTLTELYGNSMCLCRVWEYQNTSAVSVHSMNFMKFLELFTTKQPESE